jgi:2-aminoadipate transaminase
MARVRPNAIRELLRLGDDPSIVSFGGGYPDPTLFPMEELAAVYADLLTPAHATALQYTASVGNPRLREQVAARLTGDGMPAGADDVLILQGGQQGLDLVAKLLLDPGDVVVTENPTFLGALIAFNPYQPRYATVPLDDDGLDTDALEALLRGWPTGERRPAFLYTVPDFQNPGGVTMSLRRRRHLVELAFRYGLTVLEDTPYRELRYSGERLPTLRSLAGAAGDGSGAGNPVIHLGSFSKILAPSMRLGWATADPDVMAALLLLKTATDTQCSTLNMAATAAYLDRYDLDAHITRLCDAYRRKRDLALATVARTWPASVRCTRAEGGLFTWASFPEGFDAADFMQRRMLPEARVAWVPGGTFFPVHEEPHHARISFSSLPEDTLQDGLERLGALLVDELG